MHDRRRIIRLKNVAYVAVERSAVAIRRYQTAHHGPDGYAPLPPGWAEKRARYLADYHAIIRRLDVQARGCSRQ